MLALLQISFSFLMYIILSIYLFINIKEIGEFSPVLNLLVITILMGVFLFVLQIIKNKNIYIKKSFLFIILFFAYFLIRIIIDDISVLKSLTVSTNGIILFYILGFLISISLVNIQYIVINSNQALKILNFFFLIFLLVFSFLLFDIFTNMSFRLRMDIFLVKDLHGLYQRSGSFITINFILLSVKVIIIQPVFLLIRAFDACINDKKETEYK